MADPLTSVPSIGPTLAARIRDALSVDSLDALREAAEAGRLSTVPGVGHKTAEAVLGHLGGERSDDDLIAPPSVAELLDVGRERAYAGDLHTIAPRRNSRKASAANPEGDAWLPVLNARRGRRRYTALFSNTDRAHDLGTTDDWVVVYEDAPDLGRQWTVVTTCSGDLDGRRVVRGRERDTRQHYVVRTTARSESSPSSVPPTASMK